MRNKVIEIDSPSGDLAQRKIHENSPVSRSSL